MLEGKAVLVTRAGGGIGRDFALAMAAAGARVLVNDLGTSVRGEGKDAGPAQKVVDERSVHRSEGWTPESISSQAIPALRPHFYPLDRSQDVFSWDPL